MMNFNALMRGLRWPTVLGLMSLVCVLALAQTPATAQVPVLPPAVDKPSAIPGVTDKLGVDEMPKELLGDLFENPVAGISFRPPAGAKVTRKADPTTNLVGEFMQEQQQWILKVTRSAPSRPLPLQTINNKGVQEIGLLDFTVNEIKKEHPAAEVLRQDIVNVGEYAVGIVIVRFSLGAERYLRQQALVQSSERLYYIFNLTTPAAKVGEAGADPKERLAAETFKQMLDTIQLMDRSSIREDQIQRLFRTRAIFLKWSDKGGKALKEAMVPEQWLRIVKDGKDVGYSYVVEEFMEGRDTKTNPARAFDGVLISTRTRSMENGAQVDVGSQMFVSLDRRHEDWANVVNIVKDKGLRTEQKMQTSEYGFSEIKVTRRFDAAAAAADRDERDKRNPGVREIETYRLSVVRPNRERDTLAKPEAYTPSVWYIPQGVGAMLPRLLPLAKPVTYMFQSYIGEQKAVVNRYVDVGFEKEVNFEGQNIRVIPITDRIRLEGSPTIHYMSPEGKYLGSVVEDSRITILPTTAQWLKEKWGDPDLKKPENIERPAVPAGAR